jgi:hypothetical protein
MEVSVSDAKAQLTDLARRRGGRGDRLDPTQPSGAGVAGLEREDRLVISAAAVAEALNVADRR